MATRVITVRLPETLHERLQSAARWKAVSMNRFAENALLLKILDAECEMVAAGVAEQKNDGGEPA